MNRLKDEISPYLLGHANNPVNWFPWGEIAISKAKSENKPIFLSIGYSACHWCHVMEEESFLNFDIANFLNKNFISIKVDREERPDIDKIYMDALVAMTGSGGWPMSIFLTQDLNPFYAGSYFPPTARFGLPGFLDLLGKISVAWENNFLQLKSTGEEIKDFLSRTLTFSTDVEIDLAKTISTSVQKVFQQIDKNNGGWGSRPKFPHALVLLFLMNKKSNLTQDNLRQLDITLEKMAQGGFHDLIRGGFHRYSTDEIWLVPHFEKMLYDNALLASSYLSAGKIFNKDKFIQIAIETLYFMKNELLSPSGGFWSSLDADSDGEEGKFYIWSYEELKELIPDGDWQKFCKIYQIEKFGNFEGKIILRSQDHASDWSLLNNLLPAQNKRRRPNTDDKILIDWNSLAISAFANIGNNLQISEFVLIAENAAQFILNNMAEGEELFHAFRNGERKNSVFLSDYSLFINSLIDLFIATCDQKWRAKAIVFCEKMVATFWDGKQFFDTVMNENFLFIKPQTLEDSVTPSGWSAAIFAMIRLNLFRDQPKFEDIILTSFRTIIEQVQAHPLSMPLWLKSFAYFTHPLDYIILIKTTKDDESASEYENCIRGKIHADTLFLSIFEDNPLFNILNILKGKKCYQQKTTVFICFNNSCSAPITDLKSLKANLKTTQI